MLAAGLVVEMMFSSCSNKTADLIAAGVGAIIYIIAEIAAIFTHKDAGEAKAIQYTANALQKSQIEALEKEKELYEEVKDSAQLKYSIQMAAATAFDVALGIALTASIVWMVNEYTCAGVGSTCAPCTGLVITYNQLRNRAAFTPVGR